MKKLINHKTVLILISSLVISIFLLSFILIGATRERVNAIDIEEELKVTTTIKAEKSIFVDVKGAVKKPGVYEVKENSIVNDCIKLAGGITSSGTLSNINLSKKVTDEMVIYVFKKSEITTSAKNEIPCTTEVIEINNCPIITDNQTSNNDKKETTTDTIGKKININTATKEELTTLTGIGESKANSIIEYRKTNQFKSIEELKNVSGIGEALYESIKDSITV
ncbi:MAG: helix-hairpin-helix domain-containing protein [Bacilli bacterium]|nr:helix-hairpin-helix domain-containing protein [Bacilli bacterium]